MAEQATATGGQKKEKSANSNEDDTTGSLVEFCARLDDYTPTVRLPIGCALFRMDYLCTRLCIILQRVSGKSVRVGRSQRRLELVTCIYQFVWDTFQACDYETVASVSSSS